LSKNIVVFIIMSGERLGHGPCILFKQLLRL